MTPAQETLKAYVIQKMAEAAFSGLALPDAVKKIFSEITSVDFPAVLADLGHTALKHKVASISQDIATRGAGAVFGEMLDKLSMQHQRGVERLRKRR